MEMKLNHYDVLTELQPQINEEGVETKTVIFLMSSQFNTYKNTWKLLMLLERVQWMRKETHFKNYWTVI